MDRKTRDQQEGRFGQNVKYGKTGGNKRKLTVGTAHTVTVNSLDESNKRTNEHRSNDLSGTR